MRGEDVRRSGVWKLAWVGVRLFLGVVFFTGGMSKLVPFPGVMGPVWLEEALDPHGLGSFARFVAWAELTIGALLFSRRFATIGAVMMVPLVVNILAVVASMGWQGTPAVVAGFLVLNLYLLWYDRDRLLPLVADGSGAPPHGPWRADLPAALGIALCLAGPPLHGVHPVVGYAAIAGGLVGLAITPLYHRTPLD